MKAAFKKEIFSLSRNYHYLFMIGLFFVVAVLENIIENENTYGFLIVFILISSMAGFNSLSNDKISRWDKLATALPISSEHSVTAKYLLNFTVCAGSVLILVFLKQILFWSGGIGMDLVPVFPVLSALFGICIIYSALELVLTFAFGVEKVQIIMIALFSLLGGCIGIAIADEKIPFESWLVNMDNTIFWLVSVVGTVLYFASVPLSVYLYKRRIRK